MFTPDPFFKVYHASKIVGSDFVKKKIELFQSDKKVTKKVTFLKFWTFDFEMSYLHIPCELESKQYIIR